jgi:hypothetical protein
MSHERDDIEGRTAGGRSTQNAEFAPDAHTPESLTVDLDEVAGASNVLVLGSGDRSTDDGVCRSFFAVDGLERKNVLFLSLLRSSDECLALFDDHGLPFPRNVGVVTTGHQTRATTTETAGPSGGGVTVETLSDPSDLPKLGITTTGVLDDMPTDDRETLVCVRSLTALLQYVELQRTYRFVQILAGHFESADATAHYHMDPEAHDTQTMATLRPLFDVVVEVDAD